MHYARQYYDLAEAILRLELGDIHGVGAFKPEKRHAEWYDPTGNAASNLVSLRKRIEPFHEALKRCDPQLEYYIVECVGMGHSYDQLTAKEIIPVGKDKFYEEVRHFFYELSLLRN